MKIHFLVCMYLNLHIHIKEYIYSFLGSAEIICPLLGCEMFLNLQEFLICNQVTNESLSRGGNIVKGHQKLPHVQLLKELEKQRER